MDKMNPKKRATGAQIHELFRKVFQLHDVLSSIKDIVHEQAGLGTSQRKIMHILCVYGQATVPHIASRLGVSRQSVQTVCNGLISDGYLESTENPLHKRSRLIGISKVGLNALQQAQENENRIIEKALSSMNSKEIIQSTELLNRIRTEMEDNWKKSITEVDVI